MTRFSYSAPVTTCGPAPGMAVWQSSTMAGTASTSPEPVLLSRCGHKDTGQHVARCLDTRHSPHLVLVVDLLPVSVRVAAVGLLLHAAQLCGFSDTLFCDDTQQLISSFPNMIHMHKHFI